MKLEHPSDIPLVEKYSHMRHPMENSNLKNVYINEFKSKNIKTEFYQ